MTDSLNISSSWLTEQVPRLVPAGSPAAVLIDTSSLIIPIVLLDRKPTV